MRRRALRYMLLVMFALGDLASVGAQEGSSTRLSGPLVQAMKDLELLGPELWNTNHIKENFVARPLNLTGASQTLIVWPVAGSEWCGATGNCDFFVFSRTGGGYVLVLRAVSVAKTVHVLNSATNGYHDIQADGDAGRNQLELHVYRFDGKKYRLSRCFSKTFNETAAATVTPIKCPGDGE